MTKASSRAAVFDVCLNHMSKKKVFGCSQYLVFEGAHAWLCKLTTLAIMHKEFVADKFNINELQTSATSLYTCSALHGGKPRSQKSQSNTVGTLHHPVYLQDHLESSYR